VPAAPTASGCWSARPPSRASMTTAETSSPTAIDIESLGFDAGAHLLVKHALAALPEGEPLRVTGRSPGRQAQLADWCRVQVHALAWEDDAHGAARVTRGSTEAGRWRDAARTGHADPRAPGAVLPQADPAWGLAARGARVEAGSPAFAFRLDRREEVWADN